MTSEDYILGANESEIDRLKFQHNVWKDVTGSLIKRCNVKSGMKCLDAGAGSGTISFELREIVGQNGVVDAIEPAEYFTKYMEEHSKKNGWNNFNVIRASVEDAPLKENYYDFIFSRWVIAFVPNPEKFLSRLIRSLKPGGIIAIQDYTYEGMGLYPGDAFNEMAPNAVKRYYKLGGGDLYITTKVPAYFRKSDVKLTEFKPNCLAGNPESGVFNWAYKFFTSHIPQMAEKGILTKIDADRIIKDWNDKKNNTDSVFFSPLVVDIAGIKK